MFLFDYAVNKDRTDLTEGTALFYTLSSMPQSLRNNFQIYRLNFITDWEYDLGQITAFGQFMFFPHLKLCEKIKHILMGSLKNWVTMVLQRLYKPVRNWLNEKDYSLSLSTLELFLSIIHSLCFQRCPKSGIFKVNASQWIQGTGALSAQTLPF